MRECASVLCRWMETGMNDEKEASASWKELFTLRLSHAALVAFCDAAALLAIPLFSVKENESTSPSLRDPQTAKTVRDVADELRLVVDIASPYKSGSSPLRPDTSDPFMWGELYLYRTYASQRKGGRSRDDSVASKRSADPFLAFLDVALDEFRLDHLRIHNTDTDDVISKMMGLGWVCILQGERGRVAGYTGSTTRKSTDHMDASMHTLTTVVDAMTGTETTESDLTFAPRFSFYSVLSDMDENVSDGHNGRYECDGCDPCAAAFVLSIFLKSVIGSDVQEGYMGISSGGTRFPYGVRGSKDRTSTRKTKVLPRLFRSVDVSVNGRKTDGGQGGYHGRYALRRIILCR